MDMMMSRLFSLVLLFATLCFALPVEAGYSKDSCPQNKAQGRVRADMVFDLETGKIFAEKNAKSVFHPASLTKLMSLALIFQDLEAKRLKANDTVLLVPTGGQWDGRTASIKRMTLKEAVEGIATASLNNPLDAIAGRYGQGVFVERMNTQAKQWGMLHTLYVNPTGWPTPQSVQLQRTTLYDLARLVRHVWIDYPDAVASYTGKPEVVIAGLKAPLKSTNNLLEISEAAHAQPYPGVIGGKTGYTCNSGWNLVAVYEDPTIHRRMVAMSVGHSTGKGRDDQVIKLLDAAKPKLIAFDKAEKKRIEQERIAAEKARIAAETKRKADELKAKQLAAEAASRKVVVKTVTTTVTKR